MANPTIDGTKTYTGPGLLYYAPLGTADTTDTVVGSVFTDAWPSGWLPLGMTDDGTDFNDQVSTGPMEVAESLLPVKIVTTGETTTIAASLAEINMTNWKRARNGGTITTTGATTTLKSVYTPPALGAEVRCMIGWQSLDATLRLVCYQCFAGGSLEMAFRRNPDFTSLPAEFNLEIPSSGTPFKLYSAGVARG